MFRNLLNDVVNDPSKYIFGVFQIMAYVYLCYFFVTIFLVPGVKNIWFRVLLLVLMGTVLFSIASIFIDRIAVKVLLMGIFAVVFLRILFGPKLRMVIFLYAMYLGIYLVIEYLVLEIIKKPYPYLVERLIDDNIVASMFELLSLIILFLCIITIRKVFRNPKENTIFKLSKINWIMYLLFPLFTVVAIVTIIVNFDTFRRQGQALLFILMGLCIMNVNVFVLLINVEEKGNREISGNLAQEKMRNQLDIYNSITKRYELQRKLIHEFKNHISCIAGLACNNKIVELNQYINDLEKDLASSTDVFDTNNLFINTIINQKYIEAKDKGIVFILKANDLEDFPLSEKETVILLSNLINNAFDACEKCSDKLVKIKIINNSNNVLIAVSNTYKDPPVIHDNRYMTTKCDTEWHGIGIENIIDIIEKNKGIYTIDAGKMFEFIIEIPVVN